ncbi:hypothetical protein [Lysobacter gummosus]
MRVGSGRIGPAWPSYCECWRNYIGTHRRGFESRPPRGGSSAG